MKQISDLYEKIEYPDSGYHFKMWLDKSEKDMDTKDQPQLFHEDIEIKYVLSGTLSVIIDDVMYSLAPGDILIVNPYTFHTNVWLGEPEYAYHLINMSPAFFSEQGNGGLNLHTELYQKQRRFCPVIRQDAALGELFWQIVSEERTRGPYWQFVQTHLLSVFFFLLLRSYTEEDRKRAEQIDKLRAYAVIEPALNEIHRNYAEPVSVEALAACCGISASYFSHIFRDAMGKTPIGYWMEYRVRIADRILETTELDAREAARKCGFHDVNYFYRCYKKVFGVPLTCRRTKKQ